MRKWLVLIAAIALATGCARREREPGLYILQELEAASAVNKPAARIERLEIFAANHSDHPYRVLAHKRIIAAYRDDLRDTAAAEAYLGRGLAQEAAPYARGELLIDRLDRLLDADSFAAYALAETLLARERYARLFIWMGYSLWEERDRSDLVRGCFLKSADLTSDDVERSRAYAAFGEWLVERGDTMEGAGCLALAPRDPEAMKVAGDISRSRGNLVEAIDRYVQAAALMPRLRDELKLDSLYALAKPGATDLDQRILALRIGDWGVLPPARFSDMEGRVIDLAKLGGKTIVLYAWSPT